VVSGIWRRRLAWNLAIVGVAVATCTWTSARTQEPRADALQDHPVIQYATRPTTDRVARLRHEIANGRSLQRDARTGYLRPILGALGIPVESQLLVFSKTGVQRAYTSPHTPRALYFDESVAISYVPGAPALEIAAHDPEQGVVFYTLDQTAPSPILTRQTMCLTCHVSSSTLDVPGMIARSNTVGEDGNVLAHVPGHDVTHETPHPDRWGGWFVTSEDVAPPYAQRAHSGNITFSDGGVTSNVIFVRWMDSTPEARGYLSRSSDISALLLFDHEMRAINLLTRLSWESRIAASADGGFAIGAVERRVNELVDYLLFVREVPPSAALTPPRGLAERLESKTPTDRRGRSFGQLDLVDRLLRYPCSYMVYSEAFEVLPPAVKQAIYRRMIDVLSSHGTRDDRVRVSVDDRRAVLEILRDTKPDFP